MKYQNRDDIVIGTKVGNRPLNDGSTTWDPSKKYIKESVKSSLKRLGLEQLDLYQLHGGTIDEQVRASEAPRVVSWASRRQPRWAPPLYLPLPFLPFGWSGVAASDAGWVFDFSRRFLLSSKSVSCL